MNLYTKLSPCSIGTWVNPGTPSDHGVPICLEDHLNMTSRQFWDEFFLLDSVPMNADILRHLVIDGDLMPHQLMCISHSLK